MNGESIGTMSATARAAMRELLAHGPLPRAELARHLDLSPASLTKATRELLKLDVITQDSVVPAEVRGRPGVPLSIAPHRCQFIGIKLTSDAVFAVRVDAVGSVLSSCRRELDDTSLEGVVAHIVNLIKEIGEGEPVQAVGIGSAGSMTLFDDHARDNPYFEWGTAPLSQLVERECGLPVVISRDVTAFTVGIHSWGPGRGQNDLAVVTIGMGIGIGLVLGGQVVTGPRGAAGMIGHTRIDDSGPYCSLGHRGCAMAYLTSPAITRAVAMGRGDTSVALSQVGELYDAGDAVAVAAVSDAGRALGAMIAGIVSLLDIPTVILAGDGQPVLQRIGETLDRSLRERLDPAAHLPEVHVYDSDFDEWARGAAAAACQWLLTAPPSKKRFARLARSNDPTDITETNQREDFHG